MKTYDSFENWYECRSTQHQEIITFLRQLVGDIAPTLIEASKWTNGVWLKGDLPILFIHTESDHLQFGFFAGASFADPKEMLRGKGKYVRHIRIETIEDINHAAFATLIRKAIRAPAYR